MSTVLSAPTPAHRVGEHVVPAAVAALSVIAAAIHGWVTPEHVEEYWLFGAFFALVTVFQLGWAIEILLHPTRRVAVAGIVASAAILLVWLLSRTAGLPIGPEPWEAETVGSLDVAAGLAEAGIVVLALRMTPRHFRFTSGPERGRVSVGVDGR